MEIGNRMLTLSLVGIGIVCGISHRACQAAVVLGGTTQDDTIYMIQFDKANVINPTVTFPNIPNIGDLTVSFGTQFVGQSSGSTNNSLGDTSPTAPLTLDPNGMVKTIFDLSSPSGIVLGGVKGNALFTTPLAILFSHAVNYVAFDLGHLDKNSPTTIQAFDAQGTSLGSFGGLSPGFKNYSLLETTGSDVISGVSIYVPSGGMDWEGFGLNNIKFALDGDSGGGGMVPEPGTFLIWSLLGSVAVSGAWIKRRRESVAR